MIDIIIPTIGRYESLKKVINDLSRYGRGVIGQVIVVGDGIILSRELLAISGNDVKLKLLSSGYIRKGPNYCRDLGSLTVQTAYMALLDDDILLSQRWFEEIRILISKNIPAATGPFHSDERSIVGRAREVRSSSFFAKFNDGDTATYFSGGNGLVRRDVYKLVGGMSQFLSANGLARKLKSLNMPVYFSSKLSVKHKHDRGIKNYLKHGFKVGYSSEVYVICKRLLSLVIPSVQSGFMVSVVNFLWGVMAVLGVLMALIVKYLDLSGIRQLTLREK